MTTLEKLITEYHLEKWAHLLRQNGFTTPEEFAEITEEELSEIEIPEDTIRQILQIVSIVKKEVENNIETSTETDSYYLETLYTGSEERMLDLKYLRGILDENSLLNQWKPYNLYTTQSSGIILPNICPVCLEPTNQTIVKVVSWSHAEVSNAVILRSTKTQAEKVTLTIPCCHKEKMKTYLDIWMEKKGEVIFLIKNRDYAKLLVKLNGQRYPHEISNEEYYRIKNKQSSAAFRRRIGIFLVLLFVIMMIAAYFDKL